MPDVKRNETLKVSKDIHNRVNIQAAKLGVKLQILTETYLTSMLDLGDKLESKAGEDFNLVLLNKQLDRVKRMLR